MRYTPRSRDRYKNLLALLTGAAAFGSFVATGAVTGLAARQMGEQDQAKEQAKADAARAHQVAASRATQRIAWTPRITVSEPRPQRTVVERVSGPAAASPGSGGPVTSNAATSNAATSSPVTSSPATASQPAGSTSTSSAPAAPAPAPAAAPAPAPAPSSGS